MATTGSSFIRRVLSAYTADWTRALGLDILTGLVSGVFLELLKRGVVDGGVGGIGLPAIVFAAVFTGLLTTLHVLWVTHVDARLDEHQSQLDTRFSRLERLVRLVAIQEGPSLTDGAGDPVGENPRRGDGGRFGGAIIGAGLGVVTGPIGSAIGGVGGAVAGTLLQHGVVERTRNHEQDRWTAETDIAEDLIAARETIVERLRDDLEADVRADLRSDLEEEVREQLREELREDIQDDVRDTDTGVEPTGPEAADEPDDADTDESSPQDDRIEDIPDELEPVQQPLLRVAILGGHGHGKSTLLGRLLVDLGEVDKEELQRLRAAAADHGAPERAYAYVTDSLTAERDHGGTIDVGEVTFQTDQFNLTLIDTPGDPQYVKNALAGIETADSTILVVAADEGIDASGRELAFLARTMGHRDYLVVVTKLDAVDDSEASFEAIRDEVSDLMARIRADEREVRYVPCAALDGVNVTSDGDRFEWYDGPTVWEAIEGFRPPERDLDAPLRIPIQEVYTISGIGTVPMGRIAQGVLETGMDVTFQPTGGEGEVKSIEVGDESVDRAGPGYMVGFTVRGVGKEDVQRGDVCGPTEEPPSVSTGFTAEVEILESVDAVTTGARLQLEVHNTTVPVTITSIEAQIDPQSGDVVDESPEQLGPGMAGKVTVRLEEPLPVDIHKRSPHLGSFTLTAEGRLVGPGRVTALQG